MWIQTSVLVNPRESMLEGLIEDFSQDGVSLLDLSSHSNYDKDGGSVSRMMSEGGTNINSTLPASTSISAATENELKGISLLPSILLLYTCLHPSDT